MPNLFLFFLSLSPSWPHPPTPLDQDLFLNNIQRMTSKYRLLPKCWKQINVSAADLLRKFWLDFLFPSSLTDLLDTPPPQSTSLNIQTRNKFAIVLPLLYPLWLQQRVHLDIKARSRPHKQTTRHYESQTLSQIQIRHIAHTHTCMCGWCNAQRIGNRRAEFELRSRLLYWLSHKYTWEK